MTKRTRIPLALALIWALMMPAVAPAATVAELKAQLDSLKSQSADAGDAFEQARWKLDETEVRLDDTNARFKATDKRLRAAKRRLHDRANNIYRRGRMDVVEVLVGASTFSEFVTRFDYLTRIGSSDANVVAEVKTLKAELGERRAELQREASNRETDLGEARARKDDLEGRLRERQGEFNRLKAQLDAARERESGTRRAAGVISMPGGNGLVFPVAGSYYYADTWGASRGGGRRRHKGTDIMAPYGTPLVAVTSGTIRAKSGGLGGLTIWLAGDNGWSYYYAHLQSYAVTSGRVRAGQVIGYAGTSGNAPASAPHLHIQMYPGGGGSPVNPYPYLRGME